MKDIKMSQIGSVCINMAIVGMEIWAFILNFQGYQWQMFLYYTVDSNFIAGISCLLMTIFQIRAMSSSGKSVHIPDFINTLYYTAVSLLSVTFTVVVFVLAPMAGGIEGYRVMLLEGPMLYHHLICPVLMFVSLIMMGREVRIKRSDTILALVPTILYALITTFLNAARIMEGPYPFLMVYEQPIWASVIWFVVIIGGAYALAHIIWFINHISGPKSTSKCSLKK